MRGLTKIIAALMGMASFTSLAAGSVSKSAWFYLMVDTLHWCAVTTETEARAAARNEAFASGQSAWLRFRDNTVDSVLLTTESEDAYAEDTYRFGPGLRLISVERRGHYGDSPVFSVTFVPDRFGKLQLTPEAKIAKNREERTGHETYFVDWPLYRRFADFPFSHLVMMKPAITISRPCSARLLRKAL